MKHLFVVAATLLLLAAPAWAAPRTVTLSVSNMTCSACPITVKRALMKVKGVTHAAVDFDKKQAVVTFDDAVTTVSALMKATTDAGYPSSVRDASTK